MRLFNLQGFLVTSKLHACHMLELQYVDDFINVVPHPGLQQQPLHTEGWTLLQIIVNQVLAGLIALINLSFGNSNYNTCCVVSTLLRGPHQLRGGKNRKLKQGQAAMSHENTTK